MNPTLLLQKKLSKVTFDQLLQSLQWLQVKFSHLEASYSVLQKKNKNLSNCITSITSEDHAELISRKQHNNWLNWHHAHSFTHKLLLQFLLLWIFTLAVTITPRPDTNTQRGWHKYSRAHRLERVFREGRRQTAYLSLLCASLTGFLPCLSLFFR